MSREIKDKAVAFEPFTDEDLEETDVSIETSFLKHEIRNTEQHPKRNWGWLGFSVIFQLSCLILFSLAWTMIVYFYGYDYPYGVNLISCTL